MTNIYKESIEKVEQGSRFSVNFIEHSLKIDCKDIIKNGQFDGCLGIEPSDFSLAEIERLYHRYNHSIPSARSDNKRRNYFRALPEHELDDEDMLYGEHRETAQIALELYLLIAIINQSIVWDEFAKDKWFWQSPNEPSLIILKKWIIKQ